MEGRAGAVVGTALEGLSMNWTFRPREAAATEDFRVFAFALAVALCFVLFREEATCRWLLVLFFATAFADRVVVLDFFATERAGAAAFALLETRRKTGKGSGLVTGSAGVIRSFLKSGAGRGPAWRSLK